MDIIAPTDDQAFRDDLRMLMAKHNIVGMQMLSCMVNGDMFTMHLMTNEVDNQSEDERNLSLLLEHMAGVSRIALQAVYTGQFEKAAAELKSEAFNTKAIDTDAVDTKLLGNEGAE